tara:strand:+ start:1336 stop:1722 length:387 start_codon:yes stop_codon:yes gene_type:complete
MKHKAQIKKIYKQDKPPFGDNIYTYKIETTKHTAFYYSSKISFSEGDEVEYDYLQQKNGDYKFKDLKKASMYNNYNKEKTDYNVRLDTGRSILMQVAFKEASQAYISGKITQEEVEQLTNKYFNIIDK